jgi:oligosaccharide reducing-end xylanase
MSYGMYITALTGHERQFDKLWNFTKRYLRNDDGPHVGYFAWQVSTTDFSKMDPGAAPDGEEYFAMALLIAAERFNRPDLKDEAVGLINWMRNKPNNGIVGPIIDPERNLVKFSPVLGNDFTDPSYNTIAFYRAFAEATGDETWLTIANNSLEYIQKAAHPVTGLCSEYSEYDGTPRATPWYPESDCFSGDAWRVAMNLSLDYALFRGHECEKQICEKILNFFNGKRPYLADYAIDGGDFPRPGRNATPGVIAMNAAATQVLPTDDPRIKPFVKDLAALSVPYRFWRYYDGMLYMLGLLATAGKIRI